MSAGEFGLGVYVVVDAASTGGRPLADIVAGAVAGGADMVQLRCKDLTARAFLAEVIAAARHIGPQSPDRGNAAGLGYTGAGRSGPSGIGTGTGIGNARGSDTGVGRAGRSGMGRTRLVVNDRVDVFLAARAAGAAVDGVHIGQSDLPPEAVRALIGATAILGLSASTPEHFAAVAALRPGTVDYLGTGAVRPTPTKKDHPAPLGFPGLARLLTTAPLPCVAIGGLGHGDAAAVHAAGARGMAVVRAVCAAGDPYAATASLRSEWDAVAAAGVPA